MNNLMFKVPNGQNPYSAIGKYIRDNTTTIEDMIAIIEIDGITMNELFLVDMHEDGYFVWKSDWWEGEKDIALIDFFPVSDAQKLFVQPEPCEDAVSRQAAIDGLSSICGNDCDKSKFVYNAPQDEQVIMCPEHYALSTLPPVKSKIIRCKDCKNYDPIYANNEGVCGHWNAKTEEDIYCGYAERKEMRNES